MEFVDIDAGTKNAPTDSGSHSDRPGDRYAISFRRRFRVVTVSLLMINLVIGLFVRHQDTVLRRAPASNLSPLCVQGFGSALRAWFLTGTTPWTQARRFSAQRD